MAVARVKGARVASFQSARGAAGSRPACARAYKAAGTARNVVLSQRFDTRPAFPFPLSKFLDRSYLFSSRERTRSQLWLSYADALALGEILEWPLRWEEECLLPRILLLIDDHS